MTMQDPLSNFSNPPQRQNNNYVLIIIIVLIAVLVGGWLMFRKNKEPEKAKVVTTEAVTPTPTEKPVIDKKSVRIQVLNGTGTPGQAGEAVGLLKDAGYKPDNIKSANAKEFKNTTTTIAAKDGFNEVANDMKDVLKESFDSIEIDSIPLDKDSEFDIVVTTGGKIYEEPTSTPSPTQNPTPTTSTTTTPTPTLTPTATQTPTPTL